MKAKTLLLAAVAILVLSAAAYPQAAFNVASSPVTKVITTGVTERAGDILLTVSNQAGASVDGTLTIHYGGAAITNTAVTTAANIVTNPANTGVLINTYTDLAAGDIVIDIPAGMAPTDTIRITGIRVDASGASFPLRAQLSAVNNQITAGMAEVTVISGAGTGILVDSDKVIINSVAPEDPVPPVIYVKEGFPNAFGAKDATVSPGALGLMITLSGVPEGMTVTFPLNAGQGLIVTATNPTTAGFVATQADGTTLAAADDVTFTSASEALTVYYILTSDSDVFQIETLEIPVTVAVGDAKYVGADKITATVTLYHIGDAGHTKTIIPRYQLAATTVDVVDFTGSNTWLCAPFAQVQPAIAYDTGLGIANTTKDPGGYMTEQPGAITFYLYPSDGSDPIMYKTVAGSPGTGLNATGKVPAGSTYTVLVSQLLAAARATDANVPTEFSGYIFIACDFTGGHGIYTVSNFSTFSQGGQLLVTDRNGAPAEWWNN